MGDTKKSAITQFLVFNAVGALNTLLAYLLFAFLIFAGVHYFPALVADYIFGGIFSFVMNKKYTFRHQGSVTTYMITRMATLVVAAFLLNLALLFLMVDILLMNELIAQLIAISIVAILSFVFQKTRIFKHPI